MAGPQNGILGDDPVTELPETHVEDAVLQEEKEMAQYAGTKDFAKLKEHFEKRMQFYQQFLPDGRPLTEVKGDEGQYMWLAANVVIGEFKLVIDSYDSAKEVVKANAQR